MKDIPTPTNISSIPSESGQLFVLSEGLFNMNNSTLARIDFQNRTLKTDFFLTVNQRGLGDTANDMKLHDKYLWIVVNVSSQIEVVDISTGISIRRIPLFNEKGIARQPRFISFYAAKAYVCSFDGTVTRIDIPTLKIDGIVTCGRNPDGITSVNGKLYVSNSGGLDMPNYDNTVSVIDINTFSEIKKIKVGLNPYKMEADNEGDVYVISRGNNTGVNAKWYRIDSKADTVAQVFDQLPVTNFTLKNDTAYLYSFDFSKNTYWIRTFNCKTKQIISDNFITDNTKIDRPFSISINQVNGNVYITDAHNYTLKGDLLCFNPQGKLLYKITDIGLNPNTVLSVSSF
jgi:YVTN family beta-propeller protein